MTKTRLALIATAAVLVLGGIGSALEEDPVPLAAGTPSAEPSPASLVRPSPGQPSPEPEPSIAPSPQGPAPVKVSIDWSDYAPAVRARIEAAYQRGDCAALQGEFDSADANGSVDLMRYLDAALEQADCYQ